MLCAMWNLPRPGIEPTSPALAGGFLATAPPGKFDVDHSLKSIKFVIRLLLFYALVLRGMWLISLTRDQTGTPCIGRRSLNHWIPGEDPVLYFPPLEILNLLWTRNTAFHLVRGLHLCSHEPGPVPDSEAAKPVLLPLSGNSRQSTLQATPRFPLSAQVFAFCFIRCKPP